MKSKSVEYLEYSLALFFLFSFRLLPKIVGWQIGKALGFASWLIAGDTRKVAKINLNIAFKNSLTEKEKNKIVFKAFINFGITIYEFIMAPSFSKKYILKKTTVEGFEKVENALSKGNGLIVCSAHYSNWEWIATYFGLKGIMFHAVVRPLDNKKLDNYIETSRERMGFKVLARRDAPRRGLRILQEKGILALMIDQNSLVGGVFAPYFGVPASTMRGPSVYHGKTGATVLIATDERDSQGNHKITFSDEIPVNGDNEHDMTLINAYLEKVVSRKPELNFWLHPRWKKRPVGEESFYKGLRV